MFLSIQCPESHMQRSVWNWLGLIVSIQALEHPDDAVSRWGSRTVGWIWSNLVVSEITLGHVKQSGGAFKWKQNNFIQFLIYFFVWSERKVFLNVRMHWNYWNWCSPQPLWPSHWGLACKAIGALQCAAEVRWCRGETDLALHCLHFIFFYESIRKPNTENENNLERMRRKRWNSP